ncbi:MAG: CHAP domain-containing protein [Solirubrobacteraceae bacterium]
MSVQEVLVRIAAINSGLVAPAPAAQPATDATTPFSQALQAATGPPTVTGSSLPLAGVAASGTVATSGGAAVLAAVQGEVGQAEQPPGSNDSPRIAQYRQATAGSGVGPWCAYFTSWAAREAGMPLGEQGQGFGSVDALYAWAQRAGRAVPNGAGVVPRPGDLVVWDEHIGIVESVQTDGSIATIEGNSSDQVSRRVHSPGDALGYVRMG